jgi:hypothetical protein
MVRFSQKYREVFMRRWLAMLTIMGVFAFPFSVRAQNPIHLSMLQVQLWPEYDQPSMLVIYDFKLPESAKLPVSVSISFPKEANLMAVATQGTSGSLLNTDYIGPVSTENGQTITVQIQTPSVYHLEYYQPLERTGSQRQFTFLWPGDYAIDDLSISIRVPPDASKSSKGADGGSYLVKDFGTLSPGAQFPLQLTYTKTSNALGAAESVQASKPLGSNTPGRVMLSNYLPYFLGVLAVALLGAGAVYLLQARRRQTPRRRKSHSGAISSGGKKDVHCHQCGARGQPGDRFCRVCGTRLRLDE